MIYFIAVVVMGFTFICLHIYSELSIQAAYRHQFGPDWKRGYEQHFGPGSLAEANENLIIGAVAVPVILVIVWLIFREISGKNRHSPEASGRRRRKRRRELSF